MTARPEMSLERLAEGALKVRFAGPWRLDRDKPLQEGFEQALRVPPAVRSVALDAQGVTEWDSSLVTFLLRLTDACERRQVAVAREGLPEGVRRLLALARAVPEREGVRRNLSRKPFLSNLGERAIELWGDGKDMLAFAGEVALSVSRLLRGKARSQRSDLLFFIQQAGAGALAQPCGGSLSERSLRQTRTTRTHRGSRR